MPRQTLLLPSGAACRAGFPRAPTLPRPLPAAGVAGVHLVGFAGEISKNSASKASMSGKNEPHRVVRASAAATSGGPPSKGCHRCGGTWLIEERRSQRKSHNASGHEIPPGKRHPMPTTAIGSSSEFRAPRLTAASESGLGSGAARYAASALIVGCSQKSIGDTVLPSSSDSSPDSTTASRS